MRGYRSGVFGIAAQDFPYTRFQCSTHAARLDGISWPRKEALQHLRRKSYRPDRTPRSRASQYGHFSRSSMAGRCLGTCAEPGLASRSACTGSGRFFGMDARWRVNQLRTRNCRNARVFLSPISLRKPAEGQGENRPQCQSQSQPDQRIVHSDTTCDAAFAIRQDLAVCQDLARLHKISLVSFTS